VRNAGNLGAATGAALVTAVVLTAAGCGSLDRSVSRDHCTRSSDCNRGRACVAGICRPPSDAAVDARIDSSNQDAVLDIEAGSDADADLPVGASVDAPDASDGGGVIDGGQDGSDISGLDAARDTGTISPLGPCATGPGQESPVAMPWLLASLPGLWRLCPTNVAIDPDVSWLLGGKPLIQLDALRWWHCTEGVPPSCDPTARGIYFRVLEGSNSVFHFADQTDPFNGGGADVSIHYFAGSNLLQIAACDGAARCSSHVTYLVLVGPVPGA
jgi:hypothetical protein